MMIWRCFAICVLCLVFLELNAQKYQMRQYRVEHGLPSDVIKAVTQDTLGFIWIASDDGIVKYDGVRFTTYKHALHSQYVKGFVKTRAGKFFAIGDLDLIEIINRIDTVIFRSVLVGNRTPVDSTIWYPKSIYEDMEGNLWMAEPQSIVRYDGETLKRFDFGLSNRSIVFIRSFVFVDTEDYVFAFSYGGKVFRITKKTDQAEELPVVFPDRLSHAIITNNQLMISTSDGVYECNIHEGNLINIKRTFAVNNASYLVVDPDSTMWVATFDDNLYRFAKDLEPEIIAYPFKGINSFYRSQEGDFWFATDKGMVLMQPNQFKIPDPNSQAHFIEGIAHDSTNNILYYCTKETLHSITHNTVTKQFTPKKFYHNARSYFQTLQLNDKGLWAGADFRVLLFEKEKIKNIWDFSAEGNFIHDLFIDQDQNVWVCQADNPNIILITNTRQVKRFRVPISKRSEINIARQGKRGMYVAASGREAYLFLKPTDSAAFKNISAPVSFTLQSDLNITDMVVADNDVLWIASTEGLLQYKNNTISRINLGETFSNLSVSSVEILNRENILFSNSFGLFRYNTVTGDYWLYDEHAGLPSNTITDQGILFDKRNKLWIGTSYGLAVSEQSIITNQKTPQPFCVEASINGVNKRFINGLTAEYGSFVNLHFSSITFPENKIYMQWRIAKQDSIWRTLSNRELSLSDLPSGDHTIEVRAKKNTGLDWSDPLYLKLTVQRPYYQQPNFIMLVLVSILFIMWISYLISARLTRNRREILQSLVNQRTKDLQKANDELQQRNDELDRFVYSTSHDLSAPLKSLLGLISVARMDDSTDNQNQYLTHMESSVRKLEDFIHEVVNYSRNTRMPVKWDPCNFKKFVKTILADHQYSPRYSKIEFIVEDHLSVPFITDVTRLKIILNNLISNAIKFQINEAQARNAFVKISLRATASNYMIMVEDNGKGIEPEHLDHIFDMFYRANEYAQGSGLGLYILKESVLKMGGTVDASSKVGQGTTFTIILPIPSL